MIHVNCPKCGKEFNTDISKAIDSEGEVYMCPKCSFKFRFVEK